MTLAKEKKLIHIDYDFDERYIVIGFAKKKEFGIKRSEIDKWQTKFGFTISETKISWNNIEEEILIGKFNKVGICKLCLLEKVLHKESHIIPKFLIGEDLKNEFSRIQPISINTKTKQIKELTEINANGYFEKNILCENCEGVIIQGYENYFSTITYTNPSTRISPRKRELRFTDINATAIEFSNVDKSKVKLFLLSIIWRCSISTNQVFKSISLGAYQEKLRQLLSSQSNLDNEEFPFMLFNTKENKNWSSDVLIIPVTERLRKGSFYKMVFGYFIYIINILHNEINELLNEKEDIVMMYDLPQRITQLDFNKQTFLKEIIESFYS